VVAGGADFEDPGEMERLEALAAGAPDPSRVLLTRRMVDPMPFLDAVDLLVVPSLWEEPFGLVAVEGMARSLPVVVTESGGLVEIVENGVTGFHSAKDAGALRNAVRPLVEDASLRSRMGEAGRARVEQAFHPSVQIAALMGAVL
jgi:glycosyltransferase involved in cell wall biosynthesis